MISRRDFLKKTAKASIFLKLSGLSLISILAAEEFIGKDGQEFTIKEQYSNAIFFSETNPTVMAEHDIKTRYFASGNESLEKIITEHKIVDKKDKSKQLTATISGYVKEGAYVISDFKTQGKLYDDAKEAAIFNQELKNDTRRQVMQNKEYFEKELLKGKTKNLKPAPADYNPFSGK